MQYLCHRKLRVQAASGLGRCPAICTQTCDQEWPRWGSGAEETIRRNQMYRTNRKFIQIRPQFVCGSASEPRRLIEGDHSEITSLSGGVIGNGAEKYPCNIEHSETRIGDGIRDGWTQKRISEKRSRAAAPRRKYQGGREENSHETKESRTGEEW